MKIPERLEKVLARDPSLYGITLQVMDTFTKWIANSRLVFFPAYTSHGLDHFQEVLSTASDLLSESALEVMTSTDAAILVQAVLLHDCGMHLTEDGFIYMKSIDEPMHGARYFGDMPWPELWTKFLDEAKRFSGRVRRDIFGDEQPVTSIPAAEHDWTERHRMLIGEFIRRNHPRIAHEIACRGVPGHSGFTDLIPASYDRKLADIAGLVARSHGLDIRSCLDYIKSVYDLRDYNGCHIVYLMAVLRVADYTQMQSNRAPSQYSDYKKIRSPLSQNEWRVHQCVVNINTAHEDPEALYIMASPQSNRVFLRLSAWLTDLQRELDKSWATLGEIYGRFSSIKLDRLGITIRRVRSNIDRTEELGKVMSYIPGDIRLTVDNVEAFGLLVGPLYNDKVELGIRELVQNAVDAVRELDTLIADGLTIADDRRLACQGDVEVIATESDDASVLVIKDRGLGMTLDVLQNYFLRAGASYRRSDEWRRNFEDRSGHSKVLRSGRFGVGALAAFLLGDVVIVRTRSAIAVHESGYEMTYSLNEETIEVQKCDCLVGTEIRVQLSERAESALKKLASRQPWERDQLAFYRLQKPSLQMNIFGKLIRDAHPVAAPGNSEGWETVVHQDYQAVFWRAPDSYAARPTICNGILVDEGPGYQLEGLFSGDDGGPKFRFPEVSIFDPDGFLPINLSRTSVNWSRASCAEALALSVTQTYVKEIRLRNIHSGFVNSSLVQFSTFWPFVLSRDGITLAGRGLATAAGISKIILLYGFSLSSVVSFVSSLPDGVGLSFTSEVSNVGNFISRLRSFGKNTGEAAYYYGERGRMGSIAIIGDRLRQGHANYVNAPQAQKKQLAESTFFSTGYTIVGEERDDGILTFCQRLLNDKDDNSPDLGNLIEMEFIGDEADLTEGGKLPSPIHQAWLDEFGAAVAPVEFIIEDGRTVLRIAEQE